MNSEQTRKYAETLYEQANDEKQKGELEAARDHLSRAIAVLTPKVDKSDDFLFELTLQFAEMLARLEDEDAASKAYEMILPMVQNHPSVDTVGFEDAWRARGRVRVKRGEIDAAIDCYEKAVDVGLAAGGSYFLVPSTTDLLDLYMRQDRYDEAAAVGHRVIAVLKEDEESSPEDLFDVVRITLDADWLSRDDDRALECIELGESYLADEDSIYESGDHDDMFKVMDFYRTCAFFYGSHGMRDEEYAYLEKFIAKGEEDVDQFASLLQGVYVKRAVISAATTDHAVDLADLVNFAFDFILRQFGEQSLPYAEACIEIATGLADVVDADYLLDLLRTAERVLLDLEEDPAKDLLSARKAMVPHLSGQDELPDVLDRIIETLTASDDPSDWVDAIEYIHLTVDWHLDRNLPDVARKALHLIESILPSVGEDDAKTERERYFRKLALVERRLGNEREARNAEREADRLSR